jgi:hypothetical protein
VTVLAHECGHLIFAAACGFQGLELHYASMTFALEQAFWSAYRTGGLDAAGAIAPPWKVAVSAAGGLLVTYGMVVLGMIVAARTPRPLAVAGTVAANSRSVPVVLSAVATWGRVAFRGTDEAQLAATTGVPESLLVLLGVASLIGSTWWVFALVPRRERAWSLFATFAGVAAGVAAYLVAGPRLLP